MTEQEKARIEEGPQKVDQERGLPKVVTDCQNAVDRLHDELERLADRLEPIVIQEPPNTEKEGPIENSSPLVDSLRGVAASANRSVRLALRLRTSLDL